MPRATLGVISLIAILVIITGCSKSYTDEKTARLVAKAYAISLPFTYDRTELISLLNNNKEAFSENGSATRCMKRLGTDMMKKGITDLKIANSITAKDKFINMPPGLEHLPGQVDDSIKKTAADTYTMGEELLWLSKVMPSAVRGDYSLLDAQDTQSRKLVGLYVAQIRSLCAIDPWICQMLFQNLNPVLVQTRVMVEEELYRIAMGQND